MNYFQRQEELKGWDQEIVSNLNCLVLGVGGIGATVSMDLCRLGVKKIILVDMDVVEYHNLNRQILFNHNSIGKSKVEESKDILNQIHNVSETEIEIYNFDVLKNWKRVIELIKESDVVFNSIDPGDYFDFAVCKIADKYDKLLILGGTEPFYGHTISYFMQGLDEEDPRYWDCHDLKDTHRLEIDVLETYDDIDFIPRDSHPEKGGSTTYSAGTCSHIMVSAVINYLLARNEKQKGINERLFPPKHFIFNLMTMESTKWF